MAAGNTGTGPKTGMKSELAIAGGAVGALVLVVMGYLVFQASRPGETPTDPVPLAQPVSPTPPQVAGPGAEPAPETTAIPAQAAPAFDIVRIDPEGNAVVAGHAAPGTPVRIMVDGTEVAVAEPDASGNFVAMFSLEGGDAPRVMSLNAGGELVVASAESVIIEPTTAPVVAEAPTDAAPQDAAKDTDMAAVPPTAPRVLLADESGISVLQDGGSAPDVMGTISIDSIAYDDEGGVELTGRGQGTAIVQVYLDNAPVKTTRIAEDGQWRAPLPEVDTGVYTLRVDEIAEDGTVTSRSETPFKREEPAVLVAAASEGAPEGGDTPSVRRVTVQPGSTLWAIALAKYGEGVRYVRVFEANRDSIRDPDLIYPGQVFNLPDD